MIPIKFTVNSFILVNPLGFHIFLQADDELRGHWGDFQVRDPWTYGVMVGWVSLDGTDVVRRRMMLVLAHHALVRLSQRGLRTQPLWILLCKWLVLLYSKVIAAGLVRVVCVYLLSAACFHHDVALLEIPSSKKEEFTPTEITGDAQIVWPSDRFYPHHQGTLIKTQISRCHLNPLNYNIWFCVLGTYNSKNWKYSTHEGVSPGKHAYVKRH